MWIANCSHWPFRVDSEKTKSLIYWILRLVGHWPLRTDSNCAWRAIAYGWQIVSIGHCNWIANCSHWPLRMDSKLCMNSNCVWIAKKPNRLSIGYSGRSCAHRPSNIGTISVPRKSRKQKGYLCLNKTEKQTPYWHS